MTTRIYIFTSLLMSFMFIGYSCSAQTPSVKKEMTEQEKLMEEMAKAWVQQYDVTVDKTVFNKQQMSNYTSDKYDKAAILISIFPGTIEEAAASAKRRKPREGETVISKGMETHNGKKMYVLKEKQTEEGQTFMFYFYTIKGDKESVIMLTGACKPENEAALAPLFLQAASNVKLKE